MTNKKLTVVFITLLFPLISFAQGDFTISGKVGYKNAGLAILSYKMDATTFADTAKVIDGNYNFKGKIPKIVGATISMRYFAAPGFNMVADILDFYLESKSITLQSADYVKNSKVFGSPINDDYQKLKNFIAKSPATGSIAVSNEYAKYASENLSAFMGLVALSNSMVRDVDEQTTQVILDKFTPELKNSSLGQKIQATIGIFKKTRVGNQAIPFTQLNEKGIPVSLADFKGKYVLIDFWASWCLPCRRENPNLVATFNQFKNKNFTILGVSLDNKKENWLKAINDDKLNWTQVSDLGYLDNEVAKLYAVKGIPTNILVDPDGKIVGKNLFGPQLKQRLEELIE